MAKSVCLSAVAASVYSPGLLRHLLGPLIHRLGGAREGSARFAVNLSLSSGAVPAPDVMTLLWKCDDLRVLNPRLEDDLQDLARQTTPLLEKATEFSGYALAICAVHAYLPGEIVYGMNQGQCPDLWLDLGRNRGIEVAARASGRGSYEAAIRGKRTAVRAIANLQEAFISVWALDLLEGHKELVC